MEYRANSAGNRSGRFDIGKLLTNVFSQGTNRGRQPTFAIQRPHGSRGALESLTWIQIVRAVSNVRNEPWEELLSAGILAWDSFFHSA
jgi:hypothetical protein